MRKEMKKELLERVDGMLEENERLEKSKSLEKVSGCSLGNLKHSFPKFHVPSCCGMNNCTEDEEWFPIQGGYLIITECGDWPVNSDVSTLRFQVGDKVQHKQHGVGEVFGIDGD